MDNKLAVYTHLFCIKIFNLEILIILMLTGYYNNIYSKITKK